VQPPHGGAVAMVELTEPADLENSRGVDKSCRRNACKGIRNGINVVQIERQMMICRVDCRAWPSTDAGDTPPVTQEPLNDRSANS
jgi:hypothetical protein